MYIHTYLQVCVLVLLVSHVSAMIIPQIAIVIGILTPNRGGGRRTTLADWTWHQGAIAGCSGPLAGAIVPVG